MMGAVSSKGRLALVAIAMSVAASVIVPVGNEASDEDARSVAVASRRIGPALARARMHMKAAAPTIAKKPEAIALVSEMPR